MFATDNLLPVIFFYFWDFESFMVVTVQQSRHLLFNACQLENFMKVLIRMASKDSVTSMSLKMSLGKQILNSINHRKN